MLIHTLNTLEQPSRVESFHTMSPASTGLPTLWVRCSLAQREGRYVIHTSQIYDKSQSAAPVSGVSGYQDTPGHSPPSRVDPSVRVTSV